jgi:hypothetical protein
LLNCARAFAFHLSVGFPSSARSGSKPPSGGACLSCPPKRNRYPTLCSGPDKQVPPRGRDKGVPPSGPDNRAPPKNRSDGCAPDPSCQTCPSKFTPPDRLFQFTVENPGRLGKMGSLDQNTGYVFLRTHNMCSNLPHDPPPAQ